MEPYFKHAERQSLVLEDDEEVRAVNKISSVFIGPFSFLTDFDVLLSGNPFEDDRRIRKQDKDDFHNDGFVLQESKVHVVEEHRLP